MLNIIINEHEGKTEREILESISHTIRFTYAKLSEEIHFLNLKLDKIMDQNADFSAALDKLDTDIQAVADELATISTQPQGGLTADQEAALLARIGGQSAKLEALVVPAAPAPTGGDGSTPQ